MNRKDIILTTKQKWSIAVCYRNKIQLMKQTNTRGILSVLFVGVLMGALDISIVGPAIPSIEQNIAMDQKALAWVFSIYVLFNLSGISLMAKFSDRYGRRLIYVISIAVFAIGSLLVSIAGSYKFLLLGRAVQGFGSSGIFPVASAVIGDIYPPEKRGRALGMIGSVFGIAFIIGPVIAGVILKFLPWNYLFLVNLPVAVFVMWRSARVLPGKVSISKTPIDVKGIVFLSSFLFLLAFTLYTVAPESLVESLSSGIFIVLFTTSLVLFVLLIRSEKRAPDPVVKLAFFENRQLMVVLVIAAGTGIFQASFVFVPDLAVTAFGVNSSTASFMLIPAVLAVAVGAPLWGRLVDRFGSKAVIMGGLAFASLGLFLVSRLNTQVWMFYLAGSLYGFGLSALVGSSLRYVALNEVSADERATSQGMMTIFISTGQIVGSVIIGVIAAIGGKMDGFRHAFLFLSMMTLVLILVSFTLKSRKEELAVRPEMSKI
jgi:EmrB/QacA subfamily drug resistance transporter